jgi:cell division transport system ATP-binding protein
MTIELEAVTKSFPGMSRPATQDVSLTVQQGEFVFVIGLSGSGKSTLLLMIAGLLRPTSGRIHWDGVDLAGPHGGLWSEHVTFRRRLVYAQPREVLTRHRALGWDETALDWLLQSAQAYGYGLAVGRRVAPELLDIFGLRLKADVPARSLSGGERQKLALATALLPRPTVLLLDEPFDGMDPDTDIEIARVLDRVNRTGTTLICATHEHNVVNQMRRRVIEIESGKIVRDQSHGVYG